MLATFKYLPGQSLIHRLDPRTKLLAFVLVMIATIVVDDVRVLAALFVVAFGFILALLFHFSLVVSRLADQSRVLAQRVALLEERLREAEEQKSDEHVLS